MKFPERLYYPLYKAVKIINDTIKENRLHIDIDDLLYLANIGELELCYYFSKRGNEGVGEICINSYDDEQVDLLATLMPDKEEFGVVKTKYGIILCDWYQVNEEASKLYGFNPKYPFINNFQPIFCFRGVLAINLIEHGYPFSEIIYDSFYLPRGEWAVSLTYYNNLIQSNKVSFLDDIRIDAYIKLHKPLKILPEQLLITSHELNNFLNGKKMEKREEDINRFVGRPENNFKTMIIDIAKVTRNVHPMCTGKSLAKKIHAHFGHLKGFPKCGSIEQYISLSTELPKQIEKDVKLDYKLIIPHNLLHLENK